MSKRRKIESECCSFLREYTRERERKKKRARGERAKVNKHVEMIREKFEILFLIVQASVIEIISQFFFSGVSVSQAVPSNQAFS